MLLFGANKRLHVNTSTSLITLSFFYQFLTDCTERIMIGYCYGNVVCLSVRL